LKEEAKTQPTKIMTMTAIRAASVESRWRLVIIHGAAPDRLTVAFGILLPFLEYVPRESEAPANGKPDDEQLDPAHW
jgi:hypothetical protein